MASLNKVLLIGNCGRDGELRYTASGTAQLGFSLAVNNRRKSKSGEWEDSTEWFDVTMFGERAEKVGQYVRKGGSLYVEGRIQTRSWTDDQGVKHFRTEVIANELQLLGGKENRE